LKKTENYNDIDFKNLLISGLETKSNKVAFFGASIKSGNCKIWNIEISDEDFEIFKKIKKKH